MTEPRTKLALKRDWRPGGLTPWREEYPQECHDALRDLLIAGRWREAWIEAEPFARAIANSDDGVLPVIVVEDLRFLDWLRERGIEAEVDDELEIECPMSGQKCFGRELCYSCEEMKKLLQEEDERSKREWDEFHAAARKTAEEPPCADAGDSGGWKEP